MCICVHTYTQLTYIYTIERCTGCRLESCMSVFVQIQMGGLHEWSMPTRLNATYALCKHNCDSIDGQRASTTATPLMGSNQTQTRGRWSLHLRLHLCVCAYICRQVHTLTHTNSRQVESTVRQMESPFEAPLVKLH